MTRWLRLFRLFRRRPQRPIGQCVLCGAEYDYDHGVCLHTKVEGCSLTSCNGRIAPRRGRR